MATRIIKQPDGRFGLFSTISDCIWAVNLTEKEMVKLWVELEAEKAEEEMTRWLEEVKAKNSRLHSSMSLDKALELDVSDHPWRKIIEESEE